MAEYHARTSPSYAFSKSDVFINRMKLHPSVNVFIYQGEMYYQRRNNYVDNQHIPPGSVNLYEINVNRPDAANLVSSKLVKSSAQGVFKSVTAEDLATQYQYGDEITLSYPLTASVRREYFAAITSDITSHDNACNSANVVTLTKAKSLSCVIMEPGYIDGPETISTIAGENSRVWVSKNAAGTGVTGGSYNKTSRFHITALKNTLNFHTRKSPHYAFSSMPLRNIKRDFAYCEMNLVSIPSIYYGSRIKPGTVDLKFYLSGSVAGRLQDVSQRGELVQTEPVGSTGTGSIAGVVLYDEGFILLTGSWSLTGGTGQPSVHTEKYESSSKVDPKWVHFGSIRESSTPLSSSAFEIAFSGTTYIPTLTMLAHAPIGRLNHSNNPTYAAYGQDLLTVPTTHKRRYKENESRTIKNTISSSFKHASASFQPQTFISKIGIYDEDNNLVAVTKMATPVKKTQDSEYTFKMKMDL